MITKQCKLSELREVLKACRNDIPTPQALAFFRDFKAASITIAVDEYLHPIQESMTRALLIELGAASVTFELPDAIQTHALPDGFDIHYARACQWSCARCNRSVDECMQSVCIDPDDAHERRILNLLNFDYKGD